MHCSCDRARIHRDPRMKAIGSADGPPSNAMMTERDAKPPRSKLPSENAGGVPRMSGVVREAATPGQRQRSTNTAERKGHHQPVFNRGRILRDGPPTKATGSTWIKFACGERAQVVVPVLRNESHGLAGGDSRRINAEGVSECSPGSGRDSALPGFMSRPQNGRAKRPPSIRPAETDSDRLQRCAPPTSSTLRAARI